MENCWRIVDPRSAETANPPVIDPRPERNALENPYESRTDNSPEQAETAKRTASCEGSDGHWAEVILWAEKKWENRVGDEVMSQNRNAVGTRTRPHTWLREKRSSRNVLENQSHETSTAEFEQKLDLDYSAGPDFAFLGVIVDVVCAHITTMVTE
ncbi:hypothetical protein H4582DRAFT_2059895 [Lactarius indigo]|nr:hypothetical protein H4582DRAFT_2059895 [Lactarius indigo]